MQGLFGRFGKKNQTVVSPPNFRESSTPSPADIEFDEFPITGRFEDDDEETNWDDVEALDNPNEIVYPQPIVAAKPPNPTTVPDLEDWDEALPAATVKNSNTQEARRGKNLATPPHDRTWQDDPSKAVSSHKRADPAKSTPRWIEQSLGFWSGILEQFRRILPAPVRQLSDALLTGVVVIFLTVVIWFIDGVLATKTPSAIVTNPTAPISAQPNPKNITEIDDLITSPEQAFIDAIQTQLNDITSQYPDDIIQTLQVDFPRDRAIVRLNPVWYLIGDAQQDLVTDRMWLQAKANHFSKLELQDAQGHSIARSPVVGQHMVILKRRQSY